MATEPGKESAGKRDRGQSAAANHSTKNRRDAGGVRASTRDPKAGERAAPGCGAQPEPPTKNSQLERQDGEARQRPRSVGPRRILIFARSLKEATDIAKRKKYPRELWRFVTSPADTDVDPREWATITVVGFGKDRPFAKDAYDNFQARCRGYGIRVPSYDP